MDYEKKYKEALERAKSFELPEYKNIMASVFPELKEESEGERIRKALVEHIKGIYKGSCTEEMCKERDMFLAWLEKQGEHDMGISEVTKQKLEDNLNKALEQETPESWNKFLDEQGEQKPAWSEDDERLCQCLIEDQEKALDKVNNDKYGHSEIISDLKEMYCERITFLKSLKDRVQPQPKQEWNEEDKIIIEAILIALDVICRENGQNYVYISNTKYKIITTDIKDWLKSLRPRSYWKPSEGQLECLGYAIDKAEKDYSPLVNNRIYLTLKTLKEQLEKL